MRWFAVWMLSVLAAHAEGEPAGRFDYYVLALSWSPNWCATTGDANARPAELRDLAREAGTRVL